MEICKSPILTIYIYVQELDKHPCRDFSIREAKHIPYRDSSCKSKTLSTLKFAQRAKSIQKKAVVNEVMQDDVKVLREVISELRFLPHEDDDGDVEIEIDEAAVDRLCAQVDLQSSPASKRINHDVNIV
ncbi:hypothetical protein HID58_014557 [Brassica napus]|uniref:Kinesin motor domain-containing protein n=1 Tax=Brassica napus TaxID=3708 RepID=A0ABQ8DHH5_BRANA|nr:hypothetical protein HID58_014557 [Brassica napus]